MTYSSTVAAFAYLIILAVLRARFHIKAVLWPPIAIGLAVAVYAVLTWLRWVQAQRAL